MLIKFLKIIGGRGKKVEMMENVKYKKGEIGFGKEWNFEVM